MSEENQKIDVFQTRSFEKAVSKLSNKVRDIVDENIDQIIENPKIGIPKKGDLSHIRVHKFTIETGQVLIGYNWNEDKVTLTLLSVGHHENFYTELKRRRKADLKVLKYGLP